MCEMLSVVHVAIVVIGQNLVGKICCSSKIDQLLLQGFLALSTSDVCVCLFYSLSVVSFIHLTLVVWFSA